MECAKPFSGSALLAWTAYKPVRLECYTLQGPTVNCLDPGTVNTKMLELGWGPCGMNLRDANYEFFLATDASVKSHGEYYVSNRPYSMSKQVYDSDVRRRLWKILEEQTGQKFP